MPFEEIKSNNSNDEERLQQQQQQQEATVLLKQRLSGFETEEGRLKGLLYIPKNSDEVVITTTPKAGTTWVQQVGVINALVCGLGLCERRRIRNNSWFSAFFQVLNNEKNDCSSISVTKNNF
jgi:hypothetical protein